MPAAEGRAGGELRSAFASTAGGVMTEDVGAVTGELELSTTLQAGALHARVRYAGADEWYAVRGSPAPVRAAGADHEELHEAAKRRLTEPGPTASGNEAALSLEGPLSPP